VECLFPKYILINWGQGNSTGLN